MSKAKRISAAVREGIVRDLLEHRFREEAQSLIDSFVGLADSIYNDVYSPGEQERMGKLPPGWLPTREGVSVKFGENSMSYELLNFNGRCYGSIMKTGAQAHSNPKRLVISAHKAHCMKIYDLGHSLAERYAELNEQWKALEGKVTQAQTVATAAIDSVTTIGALISTWPEIKPFAEKYAATSANLPALQTQHLNSLLGLPV